MSALILWAHLSASTTINVGEIAHAVYMDGATATLIAVSMITPVIFPPFRGGQETSVTTTISVSVKANAQTVTVN